MLHDPLDISDADDDGVYVYDDDDGDYDSDWIVIMPHLMIELVPQQFKLLSVTALLSESSLQGFDLQWPWFEGLASVWLLLVAFEFPPWAHLLLCE